MKTISIILLAATSLIAWSPAAYSQGLCKEACVVWCDTNRPVSTCYSDCSGRASCRERMKSNGGGLRGAACFRWCDANRRGTDKDTCYADCKARG